MKKAVIFFSILFATIFLNSCTTDDFENQIKESNKDLKIEVDYSLYAKVGDTIITSDVIQGTEGTDSADTEDSSGPIIVIKKD